jgi:hypothetical protein
MKNFLYGLSFCFLVFLCLWLFSENQKEVVAALITQAVDLALVPAASEVAAVLVVEVLVVVVLVEVGKHYSKQFIFAVS